MRTARREPPCQLLFEFRLRERVVDIVAFRTAPEECGICAHRRVYVWGKFLGTPRTPQTAGNHLRRDHNGRADDVIDGSLPELCWLRVARRRSLRISIRIRR